MALTYQAAKIAVFAIDNIRLTVEATVSRSVRTTTVQFGDGYIQTQVDGLNNQTERWSLRTAPMSTEERDGLERWLLLNGGTPFLWTPPDATKIFKATVADGKVLLGYRNLESVSLATYTSPTDYTVNLVTGTITSVTIPNDTTVTVSLTLAPRYYQRQNEWTITELGPGAHVAAFEITRVYV